MIPHDFNKSSVPNKHLETEGAGCPNKTRPSTTGDTDISSRVLFTLQKWSKLKSYPWTIGETAADCVKTRLDFTRLEANRLSVPAEWNSGTPQPACWQLLLARPEAHHSFLGYFLAFFFFALPLHQTLLQKAGRRLWNISSCRFFSTTEQTGHTFQSAGHVLSHRETSRFQAHELITNWWESVYWEFRIGNVLHNLPIKLMFQDVLSFSFAKFPSLRHPDKMSSLHDKAHIPACNIASTTGKGMAFPAKSCMSDSEGSKAAPCCFRPRKKAITGKPCIIRASWPSNKRGELGYRSSSQRSILGIVVGRTCKVISLSHVLLLTLVMLCDKSRQSTLGFSTRHKAKASCSLSDKVRNHWFLAKSACWFFWLNLMWFSCANFMCCSTQFSPWLAGALALALDFIAFAASFSFNRLDSRDFNASCAASMSLA